MKEVDFMGTYIPAYKGYINDVPQLWFKRNDGKIFHFDKLTDASVTPQVNFTEVNGGWSLYPVAYLPAASTMEMSFTSAEFSSDLFAMANNGDFGTKTQVIPYTAQLTVPPTTGSVQFKSKFDPSNTLNIPGMTKFVSDDNNDTPTPGTYEYRVTGNEASGYTVTLQFAMVPVSEGSLTKTCELRNVEVYYEEEKVISVIEIDNQQTAVGELIAKYPVYANGEETKAAGIKGYVIVRIFKCKCTAMPGFDGSYKGIVSNTVTFGTMAPDGSHDGKVYSVAYYDA